MKLSDLKLPAVQLLYLASWIVPAPFYVLSWVLVVLAWILNWIGGTLHDTTVLPIWDIRHRLLLKKTK